MARNVFALVLAGTALFTAQIEAAPPTVTKAVPDNGDLDVDPAIREIVITFDQPMLRDGMSVVGGGELFPEFTGRPSWKNARTFVMPVRLGPNHEYQLSINSDRFQNFKSGSGEPAVPYPIRFRTGAGGDKPAAAPNPQQLAANERAIEKLVEAMTHHYSHRDRLGIDWPAAIAERHEALAAAATPGDFAGKAALVLAQAEDKHILLEAGDLRTQAYVHPVRPNINPQALPQIVPQWRQMNDFVATGRWPDGVGYVAIHSWDRSRAALLLASFEALWELHDAPALIVDVRLNGGGDETLARAVAGCFLEEPAVYARRDRVDPERPGQFTPPYDSVVEPSKQRPRDRGRVAVLIGPVVMSSCESFALMMKQVPGCVLVGAATQGSSGNPQPHDLGNGVTVLLPSWREMTPDGVGLEGRGVAPDVEVTATPQDFAAGDPVIEAALARLQQ